ncbi:T9SS type A sorting domain-containing protein [bacterium]|nr:T9SS type A sorting domain-containing protein [bacterium]
MKYAFIVIACLTIASSVFGFEYSFVEEGIPRIDVDGRTAHVSLPGCQSSVPGEFDLPVKILNIALPVGSRALSLDYDVVSEPLMTGIEVATVRDSGFYAKWPQSDKVASRPVAKLVNTGLLFGVPIAQIEFLPVSYDPTSGTLFQNKSVRFHLEIEDWEVDVRRSAALTPMSAEMRNRSLRTCVINPEDLPAPFEAVPMDIMSSHVRSFPPAIGDDPADGVVIVADRYLPYTSTFEDELAFGLAIEVIPLEALYAAYPHGADRVERIRNFIVDAYEKWGISGVFLIGNIEELPVRYRYGMAAIPIWTEVPTDLYLSAMDGDWNSDGDMFFGEEEEDDFMPELFVGRFQPEDTTEVIGYMEKIRTHRRELDPDFVRRWLFACASLSPANADAMGQTICDSLIDGYRPPGIEELKMYSRSDSTGGDIELTRANFISEMNAGRYLICHIDHGYQYILHTGKQSDGGGLTIEDFLNMTNAPKYPILYSYSCEVNAIDLTSVGAASIRSPGGGLLAILAHSRAAWTSQVSLIYHIWIDDILPFKSVKLGEILRNTILTIPDDSIYRYYKSIMALFGYPFVDVYPRGLVDIDLSLSSDSIAADESMTIASVTEAGTSSPVESVLVVARTQGGRYAMDRTDPDGTARLFLRPEGAETIYISACDRGVVFKEETLRVISARSAFVVVDGATFRGIGGDGDDLLEPGDTFACDLRLRNLGGEAADTIDIVARGCGAIDSTARVLDLGGGDTTTIAPGFVFVVPPSARGIVNLRPIVELRSSGEIDIDTLSVRIDAPQLRHYMTDYVGGSGPMPSPGDTAIVLIGITNIGFGDFHGCKVDFSVSSAATPISHFDIGTIAPQDTFIVPIALAPEDEIITGKAIFTFSNTTPETIRFERSVPAAPDSLNMEPTISSIRLYWKSPDDSSIIGYNIYRRTYATGSGWIRLNDFPIPFSTFMDEGLPGKSRFFYRVTSVDRWLNEGPASDSIFAWTTLPALDGWPRSVGPSIRLYSSPVLYDWDGDGAQEIYVAGQNYAGVFAMFFDGEDVYDSASGIDPFAVVAWGDSAPSVEGIWGAPALGDVDGDGTPELLVNHRDLSRNLYLLELENGSVKSGWPVPVSMTSMGTPVLADLDGDGRPEAIDPTFSGLEAFNGDGSEFLLGSGGIFVEGDDDLDGLFWASPAIADLDGDGDVELAMGGPKDSLGRGTMWVFESDGSVAPGWPVRVPWADFACCNPVIANFDADTTTLEILATTRLHGVYIFDYEGNILPGWPVTGYYFWEFGSHCAAADFDGDGVCEAVISGSYDIGILRADGTPLSGWPKTIGNTTEYPGNATIGDIDGDGCWDLVYTLKNKIYGFDLAGNMISGFPLLTKDLCYGAPTLGDVDGDGNIDIVVGCFDSQIYIWKTGAPYNAAAIAWPTEKGNYARTGVYGDYWRILDVEEKSLPARSEIEVYPNPFNASCRIVAPNAAKIEILNISGRIVRRFENVAAEIVWHGDDFSGKTLPNGVYLIKIEDNTGHLSSRTAVLLK